MHVILHGAESLGLELPVRLQTHSVSQTCYTRTRTCYTRTGTQSVPVKTCREISGHTFRVGVNGPECARTTGAKGEEGKRG